MKIRKDDNVLVMTWKDKGKTWKVLKVLTKTNKIVVEWVNIVTRHLRKVWTTPGQMIKKRECIRCIKCNACMSFYTKTNKSMICSCFWQIMK